MLPNLRQLLVREMDSLVDDDTETTQISLIRINSPRKGKRYWDIRVVHDGESTVLAGNKSFVDPFTTYEYSSNFRFHVDDSLDPENCIPTEAINKSMHQITDYGAVLLRQLDLDNTTRRPRNRNITPERVNVTGVICPPERLVVPDRTISLQNANLIRTLLVVGQDVCSNSATKEFCKYKEMVSPALIQQSLMQVIQHLEEIGHPRKVMLATRAVLQANTPCLRKHENATRSLRLHFRMLLEVISTTGNFHLISVITIGDLPFQELNIQIEKLTIFEPTVKIASYHIHVAAAIGAVLAILGTIASFGGLPSKVSLKRKKSRAQEAAVKEATFEELRKLKIEEPGELPDIDICFVHGLYGYNTDVKNLFWLTTRTLYHDANHLLDELAKARNDRRQRPLLFVGYSIGGFLVKSALILARNTAISKANLAYVLDQMGNPQAARLLYEEVPKFRGSFGQMLKAAAPPDTMVPEVNPMKIEYTTNPAVVAVLFIHKTTIPVAKPPIANTFSRPNLSASTPGIMRPNVEDALIIASKYEASVGFTPLVTAYVGMKNSGVNIPRSMKKNEAIRRTYFVSFQAATMKKVVFLGGRRALIAIQEKVRKGIITNPMTRTDHPNPREELFSIFDNAIGIITPPIDDPDTAKPKAAALFLSNLSDLQYEYSTGTFSVENRLSGQAEAIPRSVMHKNRLFGQSHWINGLTMFLEILEIIEPLIRDETSKAYSGIQKCKALAYIIKSWRAPPWPSLPRVDLPPKGVADELVDCYLRTFETLYRILHIPTFKRDYEALWMSDVERNAAFLIQVKLVLAIGATTYDEQFSLRTSAIQWIYEAQIWLSVPESKSRLNIISLQISLLLLLARETASVSGDMTWISAGALLRSAVYMGLHRDPALLPKMTTFAAEMRRRLWNTILEITLQSSMTLGGAPFISLEDFNAEPPGNFDDEQLVAEDPVPKPESDFTQMSIAIALRKIFPLRLAITKFLNDLDSQGSYEETLRLDTELRASCKILRHTLQGFNSKNTKPSPSRFEMRAVDFIMNRYLSSLHIPFFGSSLHEPTYAFSRKVLLETSLKIWCAAYPSSSIMTAQSHSAIDSSARNDFARLTACGSGFFRTVALQASVLIAAELRTQLQEEESIGPMPFRPDLFSVLDDAKTWGLLCIKAGETNMKGYLLTCLIAAQVEGLKRGLGKDELPRFLVKAAEDAEDTCLPILEKAAQAQAGKTIDQLDLMPLNMAPELVENWEFMMTDSLFNMGNIEQMDWGFNGGTAQESSLW
ncbi:hypothetical protein B7494_g1693 [Chlorociboria aeruginascens]|nr:hypothetical protein B7494_g1693 [Chlorociboria aeruginascens]